MINSANTMKTSLQSEEITIVFTTVTLHSVESNGQKYLREQIVENTKLPRSPFSFATSTKTNWISITPEGFTGEVVSNKAIKKLEEEFLSLNPRYKNNDIAG